MLVQFWYICRYAVNIPRYDDYDSILELASNFKKSPFPQNFYHLFDQHIEHRIFTTRLVSALYVTIFGNIDFRALIFFNFFLAILLFFALLHFIKKLIPQNWHYAGIVLSMCIFDIINTENCNWAMSGIQNYGVTLTFLASIICYKKNTPGYVVSGFLLQVLCIYTSGNGHIGSAFIFGYNLLTGNRRNTIISLAGMLIFSPLYYYHYNHVSSNFTADLDKVIPFFLHAVGSHFSFNYGIIAGVLILVIFFSLFGKELKKLPATNPNVLPILIICGYAMASQILMSFFRGALPVEVSYSSRYYIYSYMLVVFSFTYLIYKIEVDGFGIVIVSRARHYGLKLTYIVIIICGISYLFNYDDGKKSYEGMRHILSTEKYYFPDSVRAKRITDEACSLRIYCIDEMKAKIPVE